MLNPSDKEVTFNTELVGRELYSFGNAVKVNGGYALYSQSALFVKIK